MAGADLTVTMVWVEFMDPMCAVHSDTLQRRWLLVQRRWLLVQRRWAACSSLSYFELCHSPLRNKWVFLFFVFLSPHILVHFFFFLALPGTAHLFWLCKIGETFWMQLLVWADRGAWADIYSFLLEDRLFSSLWSYLLPKWLLSGNQAVWDGQVSNVTTQMAVPRMEMPNLKCPSNTCFPK